MAAPSFRGLVEPANDREVPEPLVMPADSEPTYPEQAYPEPVEAAARPMFDAASKIDAEAQATADALDNLKRLLAHTAPGLQEPVEPSGYGSAAGQARRNLQGDPMPFPSGGPAALIPMPMPVPPESGGHRGIYVLGFLTGIGLAVMAGVALYVLINMF
jgi:hypothetical protein